MPRLAALVLFLGACRRAAPPPEPPPSGPVQAAAPAVPPELELLFWSTVAEGVAGPVTQLRQTATARNRCRAEVTVGGEPRWSVDACIGTRMHLRFLSPDGERALVLDPAPELADGQALEATPVGRLWRHGVPADLTPESLRLRPGAARSEGGRVRWLGERDQRVSAQGVEVQLADGSTRLLRFDGADLAVVPVPSALAARAEPRCNPCSYIDDEGTFHMVERAEEIPTKYRSRAARVRPVENRADAAPVAPAPSEASEPAAHEDAPGGPRTQQEAIDAIRKERQANFKNPLNREKDHFERVHDMVAPGHPYDPDRAATIPCKRPDGTEVPCN